MYYIYLKTIVSFHRNYNDSHRFNGLHKIFHFIYLLATLLDIIELFNGGNISMRANIIKVERVVFATDY